MDKENAETIIALLREILDASQHQAQYLQEIRNAVAGDPLKQPTTVVPSAQEKPKGPNANLFANARKKSGMD